MTFPYVIWDILYDANDDTCGVCLPHLVTGVAWFLIPRGIWTLQMVHRPGSLALGIVAVRLLSPLLVDMCFNYYMVAYAISLPIFPPLPGRSVSVVRRTSPSSGGRRGGFIAVSSSIPLHMELTPCGVGRNFDRLRSPPRPSLVEECRPHRCPEGQMSKKPPLPAPPRPPIPPLINTGGWSAR